MYAISKTRNNSMTHNNDFPKVLRASFHTHPTAIHTTLIRCQKEQTAGRIMLTRKKKRPTVGRHNRWRRRSRPAFHSLRIPFAIWSIWLLTRPPTQHGTTEPRWLLAKMINILDRSPPPQPLSRRVTTAIWTLGDSVRPSAVSDTGSRTPWTTDYKWGRRRGSGRTSRRAPAAEPSRPSLTAGTL